MAYRPIRIRDNLVAVSKGEGSLDDQGGEPTFGKLHNFRGYLAPVCGTASIEFRFVLERKSSELTIAGMLINERTSSEENIVISGDNASGIIIVIVRLRFRIT